MGFSFQINNELKFIHDEVLLAKAEKYRPAIRKKECRSFRIVELTEDDTKLGGCWVRESEIRPDQLPDHPMKKGDTAILDFGKHMAGTFRIHIDQTGSPMDAPLYMRLRFAEMPAEFLYDAKDYDGWLSSSWIQEEFIHLDELPADLILPRRYSFRYAEIKILDTSPKWQAVFSEPCVISETSADYDSLKPLQLEDKELQRIYDAGIRTLADCMQDVFEDGPKRDRRLWLGDLRLQALADYASFDQTDLVRRCLNLFAGMTTEEGKIPANVFVKPQNVPDDTFLFEYSLFFISVLYDLHQKHPDAELVKELYPAAKKQMNITLKMFSEEGKLITDENYPVFVDWSNTFNKDTAGHAETIYVLKQFISLAETAEDPDIEYYRNELNRISSFALEHLYNREKHLFVTAGNEYNLASQVWMVLAHVLADEENRAVMETAIKEFFPIKDIATPYMYHHITEALFIAGLFEEAVSLMKSYWGKMIDLGADTFWEAFDPDSPDYSPYGSMMVNSYCHAWSCTPVYLIRKYLIKEE